MLLKNVVKLVVLLAVASYFKTQKGLHEWEVLFRAEIKKFAGRSQGQMEHCVNANPPSFFSIS